MMPREGNVRIAAGDHLRKIAVHDAKAARKTRYLPCEEGLGGRLPKQLFGSSAAFGANIARVRQRDAHACAHDVGESLNPERVALADKQRDPTILREETRLRFKHAQLSQLSQRLGVAHE